MSDLRRDHAATDSLRHGSLINLGGAAVSAASNVLLVAITAWVLSPSDAGRVFAVTSAFLIVASVLRGGTPTGVVLFISRSGAQAAEVAPRIGRLAARPVLGVAAIAALVTLLSARELGSLLGIGTAGVVVLALCLPAATALDTMLSVSRGQHDMAPTVLVDRVGRPVAQLVLTGVAALAPSVASVLAAWCLPYLAAALAAYAVTPGLRPATRATHPGPAGETREFVRFVIPRGAASIIQVCFSRLDIVLVAALAGPVEAAVYTAATRFVALCQFVQQAIATAGEPALAAALGNGETRTALAIYQTTTAWLVALLWPILFCVAALAPEWLSAFGASYVDGTRVVFILTATMLIATGAGMVETMLNMAGRSRILLSNNVLALVVMVAVDLALIPPLGALGAAFGWGLAIAVKNLIPLVQLRSTLQGSPFSQSWLVAAGLNVVLLGALPWLGTWAFGTEGRLAGVALGSTVLVIAYVLCREQLRLDRLFGSAPTARPTAAATC